MSTERFKFWNHPVSQTSSPIGDRQTLPSDIASHNSSPWWNWGWSTWSRKEDRLKEIIITIRYTFRGGFRRWLFLFYKSLINLLFYIRSLTVLQSDQLTNQQGHPLCRVHLFSKSEHPRKPPISSLFASTMAKGSGFYYLWGLHAAAFWFMRTAVRWWGFGEPTW